MHKAIAHKPANRPFSKSERGRNRRMNRRNAIARKMAALSVLAMVDHAKEESRA